MARFYMSTEGRNGGRITRAHHKKASAHLRGWTVGVIVDVEIDKSSGKDVVRVYRTGGSGSPTRGELLVTLFDDSPNPVFGDDTKKAS